MSPRGLKIASPKEEPIEGMHLRGAADKARCHTDHAHSANFAACKNLAIEFVIQLVPCKYGGIGLHMREVQRPRLPPPHYVLTPQVNKPCPLWSSTGIWWLGASRQ
eukprot:scaffold34674_cov27-Prasinocladus_malaysianus.AAC.1